jgi:hypothetical protein
LDDHTRLFNSGAAVSGLVFGLNIPTCTAPLVLALPGQAAAGGATAAQLDPSFASLAMVNLACAVRADMKQLRVMVGFA